MSDVTTRAAKRGVGFQKDQEIEFLERGEWKPGRVKWIEQNDEGEITFFLEDKTRSFRDLYVKPENVRKVQ